VASLLDQLDRRESVLLMHLAGELSAGDRAEVQRRLAADPALAADLERLRSTHDFIFSGLDRLDAADPLPVAPAVAAKRVGDVLRQRLSVPASRRARPDAKPAPYDIPRRIVGWAAVAAAIAVAATVLPQLAQMWRSDPGRIARVPGPGGTGRLQGGEAHDVERDITWLAFGKWAHPDADPIAEMIAATEETSGTAQPDVDEAIASSQQFGDGPIFNIPFDPEPAQP
jgi:anti-sigma factor RsiW